MVNITLAISNEIRARMIRHNEIKWSEVARRAIEGKLNEIELEEEILSKSKLTKKDVDEIAHKINREVFLELNE